MKSFDLNAMGVQEMNELELHKTDGGIIGAVILCVACVALLSSCQVNVNVNNGDNNSINSSNAADSTGNGNTATAGHGSGNTLR